MNGGYRVYGEDEVYLLETGLIHYGWKSGEIFINGIPISKILDRITLQHYASILLREFSNKFISILYDREFEEPVYEKLAILNSYNGFSKLHFTYIILRANGYGLYRTLDVMTEIGERFIWESKRFYNVLRLGYHPSTCPFKRDALLGFRLPIWMDLSRRLILNYLKRVSPEKIEDFKEFDKQVKELVRISKAVCCELYTLYLLDLMGRYSPVDLIVKPKFIVAEALYREIRSSGVKEIVIHPIYQGPLFHNPPEDISKEETK